MKRFLLVPVALFALACGKPPAPPEPPPAPPMEEPVPEPKKEEPKPEPKPEPPAALKKPASMYQIGGKSISSVACADFAEAAKKAGWNKADSSATCTGGTVGVYETASFPVEKGKTKGKVTLVRPAMTPTAGTSGMVAPADQMAGTKDKKTAWGMYDAEADVAVVVELEEPGKTADGKKMVESLVKKGK